MPTLKNGVDRTEHKVEELYELAEHSSLVFPAATNLTCTLTAHADANTWSSWFEVVDSTDVTPVSLSAAFAAMNGHVTSMITESADQDDTIYIVALSYGSAKVPLCEWRLISGTSKVSSTGQSQANSVDVVAGETVYARVMCGTAGSKTLSVHFRYFVYT